MTRPHHTLAVAAAALTLAAPAVAAPSQYPPLPASFVEAALCVHSGWHYTHRRQNGPPEYVVRAVGFWRTTKTWSNGEGGWPGVVGSDYGGGLSFEVGTWNRAARLSGGRLPTVTSTYGIAAQPPVAQMYAMWLIVRDDRGSFREWPNTGRACGEPM